MRYKNNDRLREFLDRGATGAHRIYVRHLGFEFNEEAFAGAMDQVRAQFPELPLEDVEARAAFRVLTSGAAPEVVVPIEPRWMRVKNVARQVATFSWPWLKLVWALAVLILSAGAVIMLSALLAHAAPSPQNIRAYRNALRGLTLFPLPAAAAPQQPGGLILQFQQSSSVLATRPTGLVALNCGTGMNCNFNGTTFTLTSTGAGGTGCTPPGTPSRLLYDDGAGGCLDTGLTWSGSTATAPNGVTLTYSGSGVINARNWAGTAITNTESLGKIPIGNGDGTASWSDPFVSGITPHDAVGTATNPVLLGGYAFASAPADVSADGDAVRGWLLRNGSQVVNLASGGSLITQGQKTMASSLPVTIASDQSALTISGSVSATQSGAWNIGNISGTVSLPTGAATSANQSSEIASLASLDGKVVQERTADYDSGAGVVNTKFVGIALPASGGPVAGGTSTNPLRFDPTGTTTQPVSGTVTANQGGTWNVGNISGTVSLPTGAATETTLATLSVAQGSTTSGQRGSLSQAAVTSSVPTYTNGQTSPLSLDPSGGLRVNCISGCGGSGGTAATDNTTFNGGSTQVTPMGALYDTTPPAITDGNVGAPVMDSSRRLIINCATGCGGGSGGTSSSYGTAFPSTGTAAGFSDGTNMQAARVFDADSGAGAQYVQGVSLRKAASGGSVELGTSSDPIRIDPTGTTTQPVSGTIAATQSGNWTARLNDGSGNTISSSGTALWANPRNSSGTEIGTGANPFRIDPTGTTTQPVSGTVTANQGGTWNIGNISGTVSLPTGASTETTLATLSLAQGSTTSGQKGPLIQGAVSTSDPSYTNGQTSPLSLTTDGKLRVQASVSAGALAIKDASNNDVCVGYYATTPCLNMPVQMTSEHAEDVASSGGDYGVAVMGIRTDTLAAQTSATGDYGAVSLDSLGRQLSTIAPHEGMVRGTATTTGTSDTSLVAAAGASTKNYITAVQCNNTGSTTSLITFKDGSGGSTLAYTIVPAGGGSNIYYSVPLVTTANTAFYFAAGSASTTIYCSAQGYKAP